MEDETRNVVIGAGKNGKVGAWDRDAEELLWMTAVGIHQNDDLEEITPGELVEVYPGIHGGVETPMAAADGIVYAPVVNKPTTHEDGEATPQNGNAAPSEVTLEISTPAGSQFDKDVLTAPAGAEVTVIYDNQSNIPHNIAFYLGDDGSAPLIARTEVEVGPVTQELTFTAPEEPGVYHFQCDPHAAIMFGDFIVE